MASLFLVSFGNYSFAQYDDKLVVLETNLGDLVIEFFPDDAPNQIRLMEIQILGELVVQVHV